MRVIVVEDNILFCDYICNFLQNADYQTVKAYRLAQARQVIARSVREDDIVLADLRLPDGESTALLEWMREQGYTHPFIMMTNYEEIHTAVQCHETGSGGLYPQTAARRQAASRTEKDKDGGRGIRQSDL